MKIKILSIDKNQVKDVFNVVLIYKDNIHQVNVRVRPFDIGGSDAVLVSVLPNCLEVLGCNEGVLIPLRKLIGQYYKGNLSEFPIELEEVE